jgi:prepilin-type N-terminal cleavage/methylation domain-containing protein
MKGLDRGFTMIELLIVVSLIVILTTMGMTQYRHSVIYAREGVLKEICQIATRSTVFRGQGAVSERWTRW